MFPNRTFELCTHFALRASHSLPGNEMPHDHFWDFEITLQGKAHPEGWMINLTEFEKQIKPWFGNLEKTYLNTNSNLPTYAQESPTCEGLTAALSEHLEKNILPSFQSFNPTLKLTKVSALLWDAEKKHSWGKATCIL